MKRFIWFCILFLIPFGVLAAGERESLDNYGVNKHWKITESNKSNVLNTPLVDASLKVYDFGEVLSDEDEKLIYDKLLELSNNINMDVLFLTVDLPYSYDKVNEDYAADFYDYNDFGIDKENYSGVLLLRNTYSADPYFNVYTFGNAQLYFDYDRCEKMLDDIYPSFHSGDYVSGINTFTSDFNSFYRSGIAYSKKNYKVDKDGFLYKVYSTPFVLITIISSVITLIVCLILRGKNKMVKDKLDTSKYIGFNGVNLSVMVDNLVNSFVTSHTRESSYSSGGSSRGSSGGGHSSGGGRHG